MLPILVMCSVITLLILQYARAQSEEPKNHALLNTSFVFEKLSNCIFEKRLFCIYIMC